MMERFHVKTIQGLENVLAEELIALGASQVEIGNRGVHCMGDLRFVYRTNYECRTALSVLKPLITGTIEDEKQLYDLVYAIPWHTIFSVDKTLSVDAVCFSDYFKHSHFIALKSKDAIVDQFRERYRRRPSVSKHPDVKVNIFIKGNQCTVSMNTSGDPLFKRGYRLKTGHAPINEVLAAGLLKLTGWDPAQTLIDPMCGSGTFLIEAGMMAKNLPVQKGREAFSLQHTHDFDQALWKEVKTEADQIEIPVKPVIRGMDNDPEVLTMARQNALNAGMRFLKFKTGDFFDWRPKDPPGVIIMNPPYDQRMPLEDVIQFYTQIGNHLKTHAPGWKAFVISSHIQAIKRIGLKPSFKQTVFNGPLECRFFGFDLFAGKRTDHLEKTRNGKLFP
jgi:putative N6-adenine-specific DNA methylase